ncbi:MAG: cobalamin biosynthesis protein CobD, partial [Isosphaeraceae bacterium]|nr:cobalamin biosynthesis protein CobD [Isosphaeraceae bacterium]
MTAPWVADLDPALPIGVLLDAWLGDPRGWPHPVRAIGGLIARTERWLRAGLAAIGGGAWAERGAGIVLAAVIVGVTGLAAWSALEGAAALGWAMALLMRSLLIYWGLAARSLAEETLRASEAPDLESARRELAGIVGRDTEHLDWPEIHRACIETVGENTNDGVVAPLFWYAVGGPVGLWVYKAISTLDSMVGYRNARYRHLGWASARLDDLAGLVPARLTWLLLTLASGLRGERSWAALRIGWRDGRKHPSPNSAWGEATLAGALGVVLGGRATYGGVPSLKPRLGDLDAPIGPATVRRALALMRLAALLAALLAWVARAAVLGALVSASAASLSPSGLDPFPQPLKTLGGTQGCFVFVGASHSTLTPALSPGRGGRIPSPSPRGE